VIKAADQWYVEFKDAQVKHGNKPKGKGKKSIDYKDLDKDLRKKMCKTVLAMTAEESSSAMAAMTVTTECTSTPVSGPAVFMLLTLSIPGFTTTPPPCRILPVPIQATLHHITLQLGLALGCADCPAICCVVDTAAALTASNLHFFTALAKAYHHTIASIHSPWTTHQSL
jgi:hypothetical protein